MKRYWDMEEAERARLSYEEVTDLLAVELMERGVLRPEEPTLEESKAPEVPLRQVYQVRIEDTHHCLVLGFPDADAARGLIDYLAGAGAVFLRSRYSEPDIAEPLEPLGMSVESSGVIPRDVFDRHRAAITEAQEARKRNDEALRTYRSAMDKVETETADLWADWRRCQRDAAHLAKVRSTFDEYVALTDGDESTARRFLLKVYTPEDVTAAIGPSIEAMEEASNGPA